METTKARILGPQEGEMAWLGGIGARFMIDGGDAGQRFSLVEHPLPPRALAAPLHRHSREDEYSFVLEGTLGALLGEEVIIGKPGDLVFKPRHQWHTFWNAGETPARILEIISPAGFENFFRDIGKFKGVQVVPEESLRELSRKYGIEFDAASIPRLIERFGVRFPVEPPA